MRGVARTFTAAVKRRAFAGANGHCEACTAPVAASGYVFDHRIAWALSHDSSLANCAVLCLACHLVKTVARDLPAIIKAAHQRDSHLGIKGPGRGKTPMPGGRRSGWSKTMRHGVVPRVTQAQAHRALMRELHGDDA
jgi:hypothetical protein